MTILQRLRDRFLLGTSRLFTSFFDSLKESTFFLFTSVVGSYFTVQAAYNILTARAPQFPNEPFLLLGLALMLAGAVARLTDLEVARIRHGDLDESR